MDWIKKNRDLLITVGVFGFFGILILITSVFFRGGNTKEEELPTIKEEVKIEIPAEQLSNSAVMTEDAEEHQTHSFFLKPSPGELLTKLEGLSHQEFRRETKELPGLRIMWPAYFFSITQVKNNRAEVLLDASEDGFGVMLLTEINTEEYPEILNRKQGDKIWLAAEITAVDPTGTGAFSLKTEYVRFDDFNPQKVTPPLQEEQQ